MYVSSHLQNLAQDKGLKCSVENRTDDIALISVQGPKRLIYS